MSVALLGRVGWGWVSAGGGSAAGGSGVPLNAATRGVGVEAKWVGDRTGAVIVGGCEVRFNLRIKRDDAKWVGHFDQPDDGMMDLQVAEIDVKDGTLRVVVHIENDKPAMVGEMDGKGDVKGALERRPV